MIKKVVGVEIIDAKDVLSDFGIDLTKTEDVKINIKYTDNYFVTILLFKQKGIAERVAIPVASAISH